MIVYAPVPPQDAGSAVLQARFHDWVLCIPGTACFQKALSMRLSAAKGDCVQMRQPAEVHCEIACVVGSEACLQIVVTSCSRRMHWSIFICMNSRAAGTVAVLVFQADSQPLH